MIKQPLKCRQQGRKPVVVRYSQPIAQVVKAK